MLNNYRMWIFLFSLILGLTSADVQYRKASRCVDLFTYKMTQYTGCTDDHSPGKPWCSLDEVYTENSSRWLYCTKIEPLPAGYYHHKECVFPFIYQRQEYITCTKEDSDEYWCSTAKTYNGTWKHCPKSDTIIPCCETELANLNKYIKDYSSTPTEKDKGIRNAFDDDMDTCFVTKIGEVSPSFTIELKDVTFIDNVRFRVCATPKSTISNYDVFVSDVKDKNWQFAFYNTSHNSLKPNQSVEVSIMKDAKFIKFVVYGYKMIAVKDIKIFGRECKCPHLQKIIKCCEIPQRSITEQAIKFNIKEIAPESPNSKVLMAGQDLSNEKCPWTKEGPNNRFSLHFAGKHQVYSVYLHAGPKSNLHYITILAKQNKNKYKKCGELKSIEGIPTAKIPCVAYTEAIRLVHSYYGTLTFCNIKVWGKSVDCKCTNETSMVPVCCKGPLEDLISRNYKSLNVPPAEKGSAVPNMLNGERKSYYRSKDGAGGEKIKFTLPQISYVEKVIIEAPDNKTLGHFNISFVNDNKPAVEIFTFNKDKSKDGQAFDVFVKKNVRQIIIENMKDGNKLTIARFQIMGRRCKCKKNELP